MDTQVSIGKVSIGKDSVYEGEDESSPPTSTKAKRFVKPQLEEIRAYCEERNNGINPERFYDYYEANGWMAGKTKMKDWKAAVRNWERNGYSTDKQSAPVTNVDKYKEFINNF
jgi:hypothetical protein